MQDTWRLRSTRTIVLEEEGHRMDLLLDAVDLGYLSVQRDHLEQRDEVFFSREEVFITHNAHMWPCTTTHRTRQRGAQDHFAVNVWSGIVADC
ncbi:hypothetical protein NPIL_340681 [Nephila pilipes]|uniref:Uncharacterized protein n=1 Tax=Nephila pilipes TaxID=299642 RepID=A0A8X6MT56_NEPPI|nr:hypothetical protein NPIL_340681 [Nephila pilipes]